MAKKKLKEKICEIFKITKKGKEKTKTACGKIEKKQGSKNQVKEHNKILRNFLIILVGLIAIVLIGMWYIDAVRHFEYQGIKFDVIKEGNIIFYKTSFPVQYRGGIADYNINLRNDPRKLDVPTKITSFYLVGKIVLDSSEEFNCDGDGVIAIANMVNLFKALGTEVIKNEAASCNPGNEYTYLRLQSNNVTGIRQTGTACYILDINDCEILKATEKFLIETLIKVNEKMSK